MAVDLGRQYDRAKRSGLFDTLSPTEYELSVVEFLKRLYPSQKFYVAHNEHLPGSKTQVPRQVDAIVRQISDDAIVLTVEAKLHSRKVGPGTAGSWIAMTQDIHAPAAAMVSSSGFTKAAKNHLQADGIECLVLRCEEAAPLRWLAQMERRLPSLGFEYRKISGELVEALRLGNDLPFFDADIAYEEWLAVLQLGIDLFPANGMRILESIARDHPELDHRFNAIQIMSHYGALSFRFLDSLERTRAGQELVELVRSERW